MKKRYRIAWIAIVLLVVLGLPIARYVYSVVSKLGWSSELARNPSVALYIASASYRADKRALARLFRVGDRASDPVEMQNENVGEMRVAVTRDELVMRPDLVVNESGPAEVITPPLFDGNPGTPVGTGEIAPRNPASDLARSRFSGNRHSQAAEITAANVSGLRLVHTVDTLSEFRGEWGGNVEVSPVAWNGMVFFISADGRLNAFDLAEGRLSWSQQVPAFGYSRRGVTIHESDDGRTATVFVPFGPFIGAFDARTGKLRREFARGGVASLDGWTVLPPLVWKGHLLVSLYERPSLLAISVTTGEPSWTLPFHPDGANFTGGTSWGGMALDADADRLYVTTGNPRPALSGITRPGDNRNSDSVLAIDLAARRIAWTFQEVAHDLWDFDLPAPPILTTIYPDGTPRDVVVTPSKMGNTLVLDRATGAPVFGFRRTKVPRSRHVRDETADYQPDLLLPEPLMDIAWRPDRVTNLSVGRQEFVQRQIDPVGTIFGRFRAPELNKDLITFSVHGGAEWHGGSIDPDDQVFYVPVNVIPWALRVYLQTPAGESGSETFSAATGGATAYQEKCARCHLATRNGRFVSVGESAREFVPALHGYTLLEENRAHFELDRFLARPGHQGIDVTQDQLDTLWQDFHKMDELDFQSGKVSMVYHWRQLLDQDGLPGSLPPWGKLVAIDLNTGRRRWEVPLGEKAVEGAVRATGSPSYGGLVGTAGGLLFVGGTDDRKIRAVDKRTGQELWSHVLDAAVSAPPLVFSHGGRQYVAVIATGGKFHNFAARASKLYVFSL